MNRTSYCVANLTKDLSACLSSWSRCNMRIIIPVLYVFAGLIGCSFLLSSAMLIAGFISAAPDHSDGMAAFGDLVRVVMLLASFAVHGFFAMLFIVSAESIRSRCKRMPS
jgi:hypothetical protein